jgi:DNA polymerase III alpha subunit (gram-positive type)
MSAIVEMNIVEEIVALKARVAELEAAAKPKAAAEPKEPKAKAAEPKEPKAKAEPKEPKAKKAKKEKAAVSLPSGEDGEPDASEYRIAEADVDLTTCVARLTDESSKDDRWSKAVYAEMQCGKDVHEDGDLCKACSKKEEKYEDKAGAWKGRVTEEPPSWLHMLGTAWAEKAKPTFKASASASAPASSAASVADDEEEGPSDAPKAVDKKAEAAAKKEAAAAKKAEAAAEKEAKKAAAEAKKEAAAAEKEAKKAAAEAKKAEKAAKPKAEKAEKPEKKAKAEKKAEVVEEPVEVEEEMETIKEDGKEGVLYMIVNGNVYDYDQMSEKRGKFVGRRVEEDDKVSIDRTAAEVL